MDFAVPVDHRMEIYQCEKPCRHLDLPRKLKRTQNTEELDGDR